MTGSSEPRPVSHATIWCDGSAGDGYREGTDVRSSAGHWRLASSAAAFDGLPGRGFPVVMSFVDDADRPAVSSVPPRDVSAQFSPVFA